MISASAGEVFGVEGDGGQGGGAKTLGRKRKRFRGASGPSCCRIASRTGPPISGADSFAISGVAAAPGPILAYAGTYSAPVGAEGAPGRGQRRLPVRDEPRDRGAHGACAVSQRGKPGMSGAKRLRDAPLFGERDLDVLGCAQRVGKRVRDRAPRRAAQADEHGGVGRRRPVQLESAPVWQVGVRGELPRRNFGSVSESGRTASSTRPAM